MVFKQSKSSVSVFVELNFPKQPQAVRHAITDGRKLEHIVHHGGQGMVPLIAFHYHKWRFLPDGEVQTFVRSEDLKVAHSVQALSSSSSYRTPRCDADDGYPPPDDDEISIVIVIVIGRGG
jgi:hypothetical protein